MVILLDFSAAFDTVDHDTLLSKLKCHYGIRGAALELLKSYLTDRHYRVKINNTTSDKHSLNYGVPQGSILGPVLYSLYVKEIEKIAKSYNFKIHVYADDVQLYYKCNKKSDFTELIQCLEEIKQWAVNNYLKLNNDKTQLLCLSSKNYRHQIPAQLNIMGEDIVIQRSAKYLGVWLDQNLTFSKQINNVCSQGYMMLRNLWKIPSKVTNIDVRKQLIHSCIISRINFCNGLYVSLPKKEIYKLDKLLKASARFIFNITGIHRRQPMTPYLQKLHFLPMDLRLKFKICLLVYKCLNNEAPAYLISLLQPRNNPNEISTRLDSDITWLNKPPVEKTVFKCRSFRHVAPDAWNLLPREIRESPTADTFKSRLKTFYFKQWVENSRMISVS